MSARLCLLVVAFGGSLAAQTTCSAAACFGSTTADPLTVSGSWNVAAGAVLDFGARQLILGPTATLHLAGDATVLCARITMQAGSTITSDGGSSALAITATAAGAHDGSASLAGSIDLSHLTSDGGSISIVTSGGFSLLSGGQLKARSADPYSGLGSGYGGSLSISSGGPLTAAFGSGIDVVGYYGGAATLAAGAGATIACPIAAPAFGGWGQSGGSIAIAATGPLLVSHTLETTGEDGPAGPISLSGSSVAVSGGLWAFGANTGADGGHITITSPGDVSFSGWAGVWGTFASLAGTLTVVAGGDVTMSGAVDVSQWNVFGSVSLSAGGTATIGGQITGQYAFGGASISISCVGDLVFNGGIQLPYGDGDTVTLNSFAGSVSVNGPIVAGGDFLGPLPTFGDASVSVNALLDATLSAAITAGTAGGAPQVVVSAGRDLAVTAGASIDLVDPVDGCAGAGYPLVQLSACRVTMAAGASIDACSANGGTIHLTSGDALAIGGDLDATGSGADVQLTTRLAAPFAPLITGTVTPSPTVIHNPTAPPCLAAFTTAFSCTPSLNPGSLLNFALTSAPNRPVALLVQLAPPTYLNLGAYGWSQTDLFHALVLADGLGAFGSVIPAQTDATGGWSLSLATPNGPFLHGLNFVAEAFVEDPAALNGWFHQPPYRPVHFN
jgi:fibronectin-binding autotransporter adhesin